jgi:DNA-binding response OmpR family regulator
MSTERGRCIDAGCDDYLSKPIDRRVLLETLSAHLTQPLTASSCN